MPPFESLQCSIWGRSSSIIYFNENLTIEDSDDAVTRYEAVTAAKRAHGEELKN